MIFKFNLFLGTFVYNILGLILNVSLLDHINIVIIKVTIIVNSLAAFISAYKLLNKVYEDYKSKKTK